MNDIKKIQELFLKSLKEAPRQSSQATRDSHLRTEKPERFLILDPNGNVLSSGFGKLKTEASIRSLFDKLRRHPDAWFINGFKNTPLAIYDTKTKEVIEVLYQNSNKSWGFASNIESLIDKQHANMFSVKPKNQEITKKSNNQNEIMNDIKKIQEFFSKSLDEAKKENSYEVIWTDRDYKKYSKVFKNDPKGAPDNAKKKAEEFKQSLEDKDKKSKEGLYRSIDLNEAVKSSMNEAKSSHFEIGDVVELKTIPGNLPDEIRDGIIDNKWEITRVSKFIGDNNKREDAFGYDIELLDKKIKYKMFVYPEDVKQSMNEAKSEDKVDTITMDVPLFLRMLEYSREDASQDMDLHDITEKAISLGKERGILQMDDYEEIVGTTEKMEENVAPNHNGKAAPYGSGYKPLEEKIAKALDLINEELCPAGKAYIKRRQAAGEKSSAYLSGRGVKVCKGQMSGKKKKK